MIVFNRVIKSVIFFNVTSKKTTPYKIILKPDIYVAQYFVFGYC